MEINLKDYLDKEKMKKIVETEFRDKVKEMFNGEGETSRIISNLGYYNTYEILDKEVPNFKERIKEQTKKVCENISSYTVFRSKDEYIYGKDSLGQKYLEEAVENNKDIINERVKNIFLELNNYDLAEQIKDIIYDKIDEMFTKREDKDL